MNPRVYEKTLGRRLYNRAPAKLRTAALRLSHIGDADSIQVTVTVVLAAARPGWSITVPVVLVAAVLGEAIRIGSYVHQLDLPGIGVCTVCKFPDWTPPSGRRAAPPPVSQTPLKPPPVGVFLDEDDEIQPGRQQDCMDLELESLLDREGGDSR